jgi:hypothetical protein
MQLRAKSTCRKERGMSATSGWSKKVEAVGHIWRNIRVATLHHASTGLLLVLVLEYKLGTCKY